MISSLLPPHVLEKMSPADRAHLGKAGRLQSEIDEKIIAGRERELQKQICSYLNLLEISYGYSNPAKRTSYTLGWPDFCFPYRNRFICWEAKTVVGKLSPDQIRIRERLERQPCTSYRIIRSLAEAQDHLRQIDLAFSTSPQGLNQ